MASSLLPALDQLPALAALPRTPEGQVDLSQVNPAYHAFVTGPAFLQADMALTEGSFATQVHQATTGFIKSINPSVEDLRRQALPFLFSMAWKPVLIAVVVIVLAYRAYSEANGVLLEVMDADVPPPVDPPKVSTAAPSAPEAAASEASTVSAFATTTPEAPKVLPPMWKRVVVALGVAVVAYCIYKALGIWRVSLPSLVSIIEKATGSTTLVRSFWNPQARKFLRVIGWVLLGHAAAYPVAVSGLPRLVAPSLDVVMSGYFVLFSVLARVLLWLFFLLTSVLYAVMRTGALTGLVDMSQPVQAL